MIGFSLVYVLRRNIETGSVNEKGEKHSYTILENVEHSLEVIIGGNIIDVFSPPRKDYL